ncbi:hypothetical protein [Opitutus sp. GAS368]|jgi:hypothetical protein|uniref:hypothetical protein n=1 Tax=Opitutus sp. GAS368 TaxID=1882749 RepID=UPI00087B5F36|nr:hypothetical protein [Opitutus sp. GAS368]SDR80063.1 hypothetical protein SAMN05444173_0926 [Opitutus sp. GAS368]
MKRLVWLLLLAFGTALAQVSPVELPRTKDATCGCCDLPGACGMPDCAPPPLSARPVYQLQSPAQVVRVAVRRAAPAPTVIREKFYVQFLPRVSSVPALPVMLAVAPAAGVPLFREHCSLLL